MSSLRLENSKYVETGSFEELNLAINQVTSIELSGDRSQKGGWLLIKAGEIIDLRSLVEVDSAITG